MEEEEEEEEEESESEEEDQDKELVSFDSIKVKALNCSD